MKIKWIDWFNSKFKTLLLREFIDMNLYLSSSNYSMINNLKRLENKKSVNLKRDISVIIIKKSLKPCILCFFFISDTNSRVLLFHGISVLIKTQIKNQGKSRLIFPNMWVALYSIVINIIFINSVSESLFTNNKFYSWLQRINVSNNGALPLAQRTRYGI